MDESYGAACVSLKLRKHIPDIKKTGKWISLCCTDG